MSEQVKSGKGGWKIPFFGKATGRTAIRSRDANDLVWPLNALGNISIVRTEKSFDEVIYSEGNLIIALKKETQPPNVEGSVTVAEIDGSPSVANVTTIKFPNGSVTNPSTGVVEVEFPTGGGITYRGEYSGAETYAIYDMVKIATGTAAGTYLAVETDPDEAPDTGIGWVQIAPGGTVGNWT